MHWRSASAVVFPLLLVLGSGVECSSAQSASEDGFRVLFPHFAAGGGFSTVFTLMNSGTTAAHGYLTLLDADGIPHTYVQIAIPPQGVSSHPISGGTGASTRSGWAQFVGSGGTVTGMATFRLVGPNRKLTSVAGVMSSPLVQSVRMPVDIDIASGTYSGFAVANPGDTTVTVRISAFDQDGLPIGEISRLTLLPGQQVARYLHADMPGVDYFSGSVVLSTEDSPFVAVSLAEVQGLYAAVPGVSTPVQ